MKEKIVIGICDDEKEITIRLKDMVMDAFSAMNLSYDVTVDTFYKAKHLEEEIEEKSYDLLFIDIVLTKENGVELGNKILEYNSNTKIVFITGNMDRVEGIFESVPFSLLLKPITQDRVDTVIKKYIEKASEEKEDMVMVKVRHEVEKIYVRDVCYVESQGRYLIFKHENGKEFRAIMTMEEAEKLLEGRFERCHRSYMINMKKVKKVNRDGAEFYNEDIVPVSRNYYKKIYGEYMDKYEKSHF